MRPSLVENFRTERASALLSRILQAVVSLYQLVAVGAFVAAIILASSWMRTPFMGAFFEQTLMFNGAAPSGNSSTWDLYSQGVRLGDRLTSSTALKSPLLLKLKRSWAVSFPVRQSRLGLPQVP
jgi:hypothetical protein